MSGSIPSWARVGAKVVCIRRGRIELNRDVVTYPEQGVTYTIRDVLPHPLGGAGIRLCEITNPVLNYEMTGRTEAAWQLSRFRPLVTKSQDEDVGLFRHHLDEVRVTERA